MGVIYQIVIAGGSRTYVGSARDLKNRKRGHLALLVKGAHHCRALQNAVNKYGLAAISWVVLEDAVECAALIEREQVWLDRLWNDLYNTSPTAASRLGATMSAEAKAKISASLAGNQYRKGIPHDTASRAKISRAVRKALDEGRLVHTGDQFKKLNAEVAEGTRANPWRRKPEMVAKVLGHLADTRSAALTAAHLGMNKENVRAILRIAEARLNEVFDQPPSRKKHQRRYFIHPDWFQYLEAA